MYESVSKQLKRVDSSIDRIDHEIRNDKEKIEKPDYISQCLHGSEMMQNEISVEDEFETNDDGDANDNQNKAHDQASIVL